MTGKAGSVVTQSTGGKRRLPTARILQWKHLVEELGAGGGKACLKAREERKQRIRGTERKTVSLGKWVRGSTRWTGPEYKEPVPTGVFSNNPQGTKGLRAALVIRSPY